MANPKPVGWYFIGKELRLVIPESGQSPEEAIEEEAKDAGIDPDSVNRGAPPEDVKPPEDEKEEEKPVEAPNNPGSHNPGPDDAKATQVVAEDTDKTESKRETERQVPHSNGSSWDDLAAKIGAGIH